MAGRVAGESGGQHGRYIGDQAPEPEQTGATEPGCSGGRQPRRQECGCARAWHPPRSPGRESARYSLRSHVCRLADPAVLRSKPANAAPPPLTRTTRSDRIRPRLGPTRLPNRSPPPPPPRPPTPGDTPPKKGRDRVPNKVAILVTRRQLPLRTRPSEGAPAPSAFDGPSPTEALDRRSPAGARLGRAQAWTGPARTTWSRAPADSPAGRQGPSCARRAALCLLFFFRPARGGGRPPPGSLERAPGRRASPGPLCRPIPARVACMNGTSTG